MPKRLRFALWLCSSQKAPPRALARKIETSLHKSVLHRIRSKKQHPSRASAHQRTEPKPAIHLALVHNRWATWLSTICIITRRKWPKINLQLYFPFLSFHLFYSLARLLLELGACCSIYTFATLVVFFCFPVDYLYIHINVGALKESEWERTIWTFLVNMFPININWDWVLWANE